MSSDNLWSSVLLIPGHVGVTWKVLRMQCTFGNQGSHSEEPKKARFLEFIVEESE